jgi:peptidoglycan/LPS O-acetylase OafA/YrhL
MELLSGGKAIMRINLPSAVKNKRSPILDALRFVLAFWVVMGHFGVIPVFAGAESTRLFGHPLPNLWSSIVWGIPAVMGFFVISGFCIHLPFRHDEELAVGRYYARRYIRILVPVIAALAIHRLAGDRSPIFGMKSVLWVSVLWSLLCEEIYYAVYPIIRPIRKRFGWSIVLPAAFVLALFTSTFPRLPSWTEYGPLRTALILFPIWLLGCHLAEISDQLPPINSAATIWGWRFLIWAASWVCEVLNFELGLPFTQTMLWFGVLAYFWLKKEIAYGTNHNPPALLAWGGAWSYSLYLMHVPAMVIFQKLPLPNFGHFFNWTISTAFMLGVSYLFFLAIERPSHRLARKFQPLGGHPSVPQDSRVATGELAGSKLPAAGPPSLTGSRPGD